MVKRYRQVDVSELKPDMFGKQRLPGQYEIGYEVQFLKFGHPQGKTCSWVIRGCIEMAAAAWPEDSPDYCVWHDGVWQWEWSKQKEESYTGPEVT